MASDYQLAVGHSEIGNLTSIDNLDSGNFKNYLIWGMLTEWHDYESRELDGNRRYRVYGRPWCAWIFFNLTKDTLDYLLTTLTPSESGEVTIRTLNKRTGEFEIYNAIMHAPDIGNPSEAQYDMTEWFSVRFEMRDLELITPP